MDLSKALGMAIAVEPAMDGDPNLAFMLKSVDGFKASQLRTAPVFTALVSRHGVDEILMPLRHHESLCPFGHWRTPHRACQILRHFKRKNHYYIITYKINLNENTED
jgi:hypothetical protein